MKLLKFLFLSFLIYNFNHVQAQGFPNEYYTLRGKEAKDYFFNYLYKKIRAENIKILEERDFILSLKGKKNFRKNSKKYKRLIELQKKYKVQNIYNYKKFLKRIDIIPPSLAIAQAATESAWGKSRFVKQANNIFGHWTYNTEIGMVPLERDEDKRHLIRIFPSLQASISVYMRNLNRTPVYKQFRENREKMRKNNFYIDGYILSEDMTEYSAIGYKYVKILKSIIKKYELSNLDKKFNSRVILLLKSQNDS